MTKSVNYKFDNVTSVRRMRGAGIYRPMACLSH